MQQVEIYLKKIEGRIGESALYSGKAVFIIGFFVHMFVFLNHYPTYSGLNLFINDGKWHAIEGRWFSAIIEKITSYATIPTVIGILSLLCWAVAFATIVKIFDIRNKISIVLSAGVFISFPSIAAYYTFLYTAHCFAMGAMLACLGAYCLISESSKNYLTGVLLLILALASYQAVLAIAMTILAVTIGLRVLEGKELKILCKQTIRYISAVFISLIIYYSSFKAYLAVAQVESYRSLDVSIESVLNGIRKCYGGTYWFFSWGSVFSLLPGKIIILILIFLNLFNLGCVAISQKSILNHIRTRYALLILLIIAFPIVTEFCFLISPEETRTYRLFIAYIIFFILPTILSERYEENINLVFAKKKLISGYYSLIVIYSIITISFFCIVDNIAYMNMHLQYEREYSLAVRIVDRIENTEGYSPGMPVVIVMLKDYNHLYGGTLSSDLDQLIPGMEQQGWGYMHDSLGIENFIKQFIQTNVNITYYTREEYGDVELNKWPQVGSTCIVDGKLFLYLS